VPDASYAKGGAVRKVAASCADNGARVHLSITSRVCLVKRGRPLWVGVASTD